MLRIIVYGLGLLVIANCSGGGGGDNNKNKPVAENLTASVGVGMTLLGQLKSSNPLAGTLTFTLDSNGSQGTVTLLDPATGLYRYTTSATTNSSDSFTYHSSDGENESNTATVSISIIDTGGVPIAQSDRFDDVLEGQTYTKTAEDGVLLGDSVPSQAGSYSVELVTAPVHATNGGFTLRADGSFSYQHDGSEPVGADAQDSFQYKIVSGSQESAIATVQLTINPTDDPPTAIDDQYDNIVMEGGTVMVPANEGVLSNDSDPDTPGAVFTATLVTGSEPQFGALIFNADGSFEYTHDGSENLQDRFGYTIGNGAQQSPEATVIINITPVNDAPTIVSNNLCGSTLRENAVIDSVIASDPDNTLLSYSIVSNGSLGTASIDATTGDFVYTPNGSNWGTDRFVVRVEDTDATPLSAETTVTVVVGPRIMPLGDSITTGTIDSTGLDQMPMTPILPLPEDRIGYRQRLFTQLSSMGYRVDAVGTRDSNEPGSAREGYGYNAVPSFDFASQGHGGWSSTEIADGRGGVPNSGIVNWLNTLAAEGKQPDIILLHIGTNDFVTPGVVPTTSHIDRILDKIGQYELDNNTQITVLLAKIISRTPGNRADVDPADVITFNNNVESLFNARISAGSRPQNLYLVDQYSQLSYTQAGPDQDIFDDTHPSQSGYNKMADKWLNDLVVSYDLLPTCP